MTSEPSYLAGQYRTAANLNARIHLHQRFSVNAYGWQRWVFDQYTLPERCRILELGCGPATTWVDNLDRLPPGWQILLTDFSLGMIEQAGGNLAGQAGFEFKVVDAQSLPLPFEAGSFDAVIANHMLYHIKGRSGLFSEIRRVLQPGGALYATTIGERHLAELNELAARFNPALAFWGNAASEFTLENGAAQMAASFSDISLRRYEDGLLVTEAGPLVDYILSGWADSVIEKREDLLAFIEREMRESGGVIRITKDSGMFICVL